MNISRRRSSSRANGSSSRRRSSRALSMSLSDSNPKTPRRSWSTSRRRRATYDEFKKQSTIKEEDEDDISTWGGASASYRDMVLSDLEQEEDVLAKEVDLTPDEILEKFDTKKHRPAGLENLGNTCYFNSVLQILLSCRDFIEAIMYSKGSISSAMQMSVRDFFSNNIVGGVHSPKSLVQLFRAENRSFDNDHEHDSAEAFSALIDQFNKENKEIGVLFGVHFLVQRKVHVNFRKQPVVSSNDMGYVLRLLCQDRTGALFHSLQECLEYEFGWKEQDDKFYWEEDDKRYPFEQRALIRHDSLPQYLLIHLARFTVYRKDTQKLKHEILFSDTLDLAPYTTDESCDGLYTLKGAITHVGATAYSGHYTSTIETTSGIIFKCNDELISKKRKIPASGAYMLLFTRK